MKYPPYSKYKLSEISWLGDVPDHWDITPLKFAVYRAEEKVEADGEDPIPYVGLEHIESWTGRLLPLDLTLIPSGISSRFRAGDTLFGKLRPYLAKAWNAEFTGLCSSEFLVLRSIRLHRRFLLYLLLTDGFVSLVDASTYGAKMPRANWDFIGSCKLALPPEGEQLGIATFLDSRSAKIDKLIAKRRALIERLREKRTAMIARTVTRGLPPDAARAAGFHAVPRLKPSGIEWLGEVPAHWETGNLRRFATMKTGHTPSRSEPTYWEDCDIPWFTLADVWQLRDERSKYLGETRECISQLGLTNSAAELLPAGTVVFSRTASVGFSGIMPRPMATTQHFWNWIPRPKLLSDYLLYLFRAMRQEFERLTMGSTHKTIYQPDAARLSICVPPREEQRAITDYLDRETVKLDWMVEKVEAAIARLQEYRAALITAAVTGKIDVRGDTA